MLHFWDPAALPYKIDWAAWATFAVGIVAVAGAVWVGSRQSKITARQADIMDRQAEIMEKQTNLAAQQADTEQVRLRAELYDRRVAIFAAIDQYIMAAMMDAASVPVVARDGLLASVAVARYLLGTDVEEIAREAHRVTYRLARNLRTAGSANVDEGMRERALKQSDDDLDNLIAIDERLRVAKDRYLRLTILTSADGT